MTSTATIKRALTPYNPANVREVEMMMGKAMCAYANWQSVESDRPNLVIKYGAEAVAETITMRKSEYEATVRCIDMFVRESVPEICIVVIGRVKSEFGI